MRKHPDQRVLAFNFSFNGSAFTSTDDLLVTIQLATLESGGLMVFRTTVLHRISKPTVLGLMATVMATLIACESEEETAEQEEDLTIFMELDRQNLDAESGKIAEERKSVQRERKRLNEERKRLETQLSTLTTADAAVQKQLKEQRAKLDAEEKTVDEKLKRFESEEKKLEAKRNALLKQLETQAQSKVSLRQRESWLARREQQLADREAALIKREAAVAAREERVSQSLAKIATRLDGVQSAPTSGNATRAQAESAKQTARATLNRRGILLADLSQTNKARWRQASVAMESKNYLEAVAYFNQIQVSVEEMAIDRQFIAGKLSRINRDVSAKKLPTRKRKQANTLLEQLGDAFNDGRYDTANNKANALARLLGSK